jgi:RecA-family ATPase
MKNEGPHRRLKAAGAEADHFEQSEPTASLASFQLRSLVVRAIAEASEADAPLVAALAYARGGWPVFPCSPKDKKPLTLLGFKDATREAKQLRAWWAKWPDAMIGLRTGPEAGVFVLDVDCDETTGIDGFVALAVLKKQHGALPETLRSVTPRGGSHYFFCWRDGIRNSAGKLGLGLDIRGDGGYCILPPSQRSDGRHYEWAELSAAEPCDAPAWLIQLATRRKGSPTAQPSVAGTGDADAYARAALERECAAVVSAQPGTRNESLNRAAFSLFQLVAGGALSESEVHDRLYGAAVASGLVADDGADAVRATIESGASAGLIKPRTIPEPRARYGANGDSNGANQEGTKQDESLRFCDIAAWANSEPPEREWAVPDRFPLRNVALLSGEGSVGKSILLMQLGVAHVLAKDWLGTLPKPGPFLLLNAEDDEGELHRRLADIAAHYGATLTELKDHLHILSLAGHDAVLGRPDRSGAIQPTWLFRRLKEAARNIQPTLIGLDTSADIFAGNENDRAQVRQFIGLLRGMAIEANALVIICAHPSLTGIMSGTGLSGTTGWHNSVRARAYMRTLKTEGGAESDRNLRVLEFLKLQYGPTAESLTLRWRNGVFVPEPKAGSLEKLAADAKADTVFLELVERFTRQGRTVGDKKGHSYAPALFAKEPEAEAAGLRKEALADAMRRLFASNQIHVESYGRPANPHHRIAAGPAQ